MTARLSFSNMTVVTAPADTSELDKKIRADIKAQQLEITSDYGKSRNQHHLSNVVQSRKLAYGHAFRKGDYAAAIEEIQGALRAADEHGSYWQGAIDEMKEMLAVAEAALVPVIVEAAAPAAIEAADAQTIYEIVSYFDESGERVTRQNVEFRDGAQGEGFYVLIDIAYAPQTILFFEGVEAAEDWAKGYAERIHEEADCDPKDI